MGQSDRVVQDGIKDQELLRQFSQGGDERAFAELMRRHGPLVLRVCQQVLGNRHDAEDAFQATFLVLAARCRTIHRPRSLASWLYKTAFRTAMRSAKRRQRYRMEPLAAEACASSDTLQRVYERSLQLALHEELNTLPSAYRNALVLCYLRGLTRKEAAQELDCSESSVKAKLARGRQLLRMRLARRGVALSLAVATARAVEACAQPALPLELLTRTAVSCVPQTAFPTFRTMTNTFRLMNKGEPSMSLAVASKWLCAAVLFAAVVGWGLSAQIGLPLPQVAHDFAEFQPLPRTISPTQPNPEPIHLASFEPPADSGNTQSAEQVREQLELVRQKAQAYQTLRDIEQRQAELSEDPLSRRAAMARSELHSAEAERLTKEANELAARLKEPAQAGGDTDRIMWLGLDEVGGIYFYPRREAIPCCRTNNLAYGRQVTASSQEEVINNLAQLAVDGDLSTRWCADGPESKEWIQVDLGSVKRLQHIRIHWEMMDTAYSYQIQTSVDGVAWQMAADVTKAPPTGHMPEHRLDGPQARYVRITFLGSDNGFWGSIREIEVSDGPLSPAPKKEWKKVRDADKEAFGDSFIGIIDA